MVKIGPGGWERFGVGFGGEVEYGGGGGGDMYRLGEREGRMCGWLDREENRIPTRVVSRSALEGKRFSAESRDGRPSKTMPAVAALCRRHLCLRHAVVFFRKVD